MRSSKMLDLEVKFDRQEQWKICSRLLQLSCLNIRNGSSNFGKKLESVFFFLNDIRQVAFVKLQSHFVVVLLDLHAFYESCMKFWASEENKTCKNSIIISMMMCATDWKHMILLGSLIT